MPYKQDFYHTIAKTIEYRLGVTWLGTIKKRPANNAHPASVVLSFELGNLCPEVFLEKAKYALEEFGNFTFAIVSEHSNQWFPTECFLRFDIPVPENWANLSIEEVNRLADEHHWILPYYLKIR